MSRDKELLARAVRKDWLAGMRPSELVRKHKVTPAFVRYHTVDNDYEKRRWMSKRERTRVDVECRDCGDPASVTQGAIDKRKRLNMGPYQCRRCGQWGKAEVKPIEYTGDEWRRPEEILDGEHGVRHWAWQQVKAMTRKERHAVAVGLDRLEVIDESRPARKASLSANRKLAA